MFWELLSVFRFVCTDLPLLYTTEICGGNFPELACFRLCYTVFLSLNTLILQGIEMLSLGSFKTGAILLVWDHLFNFLETCMPIF
jgi:hypothetical protein